MFIFLPPPSLHRNLFKDRDHVLILFIPRRTFHRTWLCKIFLNEVFNKCNSKVVNVLNLIHPENVMKIVKLFFLGFACFFAVIPPPPLVYDLFMLSFIHHNM